MSSLAKCLEKFWYSKNPFVWLVWPFTLPFYLLTLIRRCCYQIGLFKVVQVDKPVVVVGNITAGGTGKTPFIGFLVKNLQSKGLKVAVVSRGYGGNYSEPVHLVSETDSVEKIGDEVFMQFNRLNVPMAVSKNRVLAVEVLIANYDIDLVISDDGLQHYPMGRCYEIALIDSHRAFGNRMMMPFGPLREPVSRLKSVDFVIENVNHLNSQKVAGNEFQVTSARMNLEVEGFFHLLSETPVTSANFSESRVVAVAGIGNPQRFFSTLQTCCKSFEKCIFPDHHQFTEADFGYSEDTIVIMTEKDAVKCRSFAKSNWYYLRVKAEMPENSFKKLYNHLSQQCLENLL
ncbi:MAG: tetraacyldisaccharide 4'-kinase [Gammaproteobacteria bacterium]|nr:tetraacyldisaccharide 4'-kinase [Gammaproteobacteria bacterium]